MNKIEMKFKLIPISFGVFFEQRHKWMKCATQKILQPQQLVLLIYLRTHNSTESARERYILYLKVFSIQCILVHANIYMICFNCPKKQKFDYTHFIYSYMVKIRIQAKKLWPQPELGFYGQNPVIANMVVVRTRKYGLIPANPLKGLTMIPQNKLGGEYDDDDRKKN